MERRNHSYELIDENDQITILSTRQYEQVEVSYTTNRIKESVWIGTFSGSLIRFPKPKVEGRIFYHCLGDGEAFTVSNRRITLEGSFNMRDLGGYIGYEHRMVQWGKLYRSDDLSQLTLQDMPIVEALQLHTIIDFRSNEERIKRPNKQLSGVITYHLDPNAPTLALASSNLSNDKEKVERLIQIAESEKGKAYFDGKLNEMKDQMVKLVKEPYANERYRSMLDHMLQQDGAPLLQHCRGGKDRTGFGAALILFALGVSKEQVLKDYMLTSQYMKKRNDKRIKEYAAYTDNAMVLDYLYSLMDTRSCYMEAAIEEMERIGGSIDGYLETVMKLTKDEKAILRDLYLE